MTDDVWRAAPLPKLYALMRDAGEAEPRDLMRIRVSFTSGRTWGPTRVVRSDAVLEPLMSQTWPPCACPLCAA